MKTPAYGLLILFLILGLDECVFGQTPSSEPPPRLKKKVKSNSEKTDKPSTEEKNPAEETAKTKVSDPRPQPRPGEDMDRTPDDSEDDEQIILARIAKNMRTAENRLADQESGENTQDTQREVLKDLDRLIEESQNDSSDSSSTQDQSSQPNAPQKSGKDKQGKSKQRMSKKGQTARQMARPGQQKQPSPQGGQQPGKAAKRMLDGAPDKPTELNKDVWGSLTETLRAQMNAYASREEFMAKYRDLLKQYYTTIAEKGERMGE